MSQFLSKCARGQADPVTEVGPHTLRGEIHTACFVSHTQSQSKEFPLRFPNTMMKRWRLNVKHINTDLYAHSDPNWPLQSCGWLPGALGVLRLGAGFLCPPPPSVLLGAVRVTMSLSEAEPHAPDSGPSHTSPHLPTFLLSDTFPTDLEA